MGYLTCEHGFELYCRVKGLEYDKDGDSARRGQLVEALFHHLNDLAFLKMDPPKTLGRE